MDPPIEKSQITDFFQLNIAEANDGVVHPLCHADRDGGEFEFQDCELSFPALDECGDKQSGTFVMPLSSRDLVQTTRFKILATAMILFLASVKM